MKNKLFVSILIATLLACGHVECWSQMPNVVSIGTYTNVPYNLTGAVQVVSCNSGGGMALLNNNTVAAWTDSVLHQNQTYSNIVAIDRKGFLLTSDGRAVPEGVLPLGVSNIVQICYPFALRADGELIYPGWPVAEESCGPGGWPKEYDRCLRPGLNVNTFDYLYYEGGNVFMLGNQNFYNCRGFLGGYPGPLDACEIGGNFEIDDSVTSISMPSTIKFGYAGQRIINLMVLSRKGYFQDYFGPNPYATISNFVAISVCPSGDYGLALKSDGTVIGRGAVPTNIAFRLGQLSNVVSMCASDNHAVFALELNTYTPPYFTRNPSSQTSQIGGTAYMFCKAYGGLRITYQWYFGTNLLQGATNTTLVLNGLHAQQEGQYYCVANNGYSVMASQTAALRVVPALRVDMIPVISLVGEVGYTYALQYLSAFNVTNSWAVISNVTITNNPQYYFDVSAIGQPQRFYRLVQVP